MECASARVVTKAVYVNVISITRLMIQNACGRMSHVPDMANVTVASARALNRQ